MAVAQLSREALLILENRGTILDVAREVSRILRDTGIDGAVIGGIAVVLHGHVRTTRDVDVFVAGDFDGFVAALRQHGFVFDPDRRQFTRNGVPVHLIKRDMVRILPGPATEVDGILTVELADLISMKLRSGTENMLRPQDLADVIGLIRARSLSKDFASRIHRTVRKEFRRYADAVAREK